ncbi:MAG TPA: thioredoxin family protein [bacterium]|jgi:thiol:disulfide interchange protein|nr:thioredoxin family protein [bacterium]
MPILKSNPYSAKVMPPWMVGITLLLFAALVGAGFYQRQHPVVLKDLIQWVPAEQAQKAAAALKKPILYDFSADWCPPSKQMRRDVFKNREASDWINQNFIPVKVLDRPGLGENDPAITELQKKFEIEAFPTLIVWVADDKSQREVGYSDKTQIMRFLQGELAFLATAASSTPTVVSTPVK